jgi:uncharacterized membrane protein YbaN (DUF454 family)
MVSHAKRIAWILTGLVSLALGTLGVFLPLLPTTPFILVSAFAFAKSSDRLHQWLVDHDVFGPLIANWREHGAISRKTKIVSIASMVAILAISTLLAVQTYIIVIQAVVLSCSATFILTRPVPPHRS